MESKRKEDGFVSFSELIRNDEKKAISFVWISEFDIDKGSVLKHSFPSILPEDQIEEE